MDDVNAQWKFGRTEIRRMQSDEHGFMGLANYLSKQPRGKEDEHKKRWKSSKGLRKPRETRSFCKFSMKKIREMIEDRNSIRSNIEKKYPGMIYVSEDARYNSINGKVYFYIRMCIP